MDFILTAHDPFSGLHDSNLLHKASAALVPRAAGDFMTGVTVAVEAIYIKALHCHEIEKAGFSVITM